MHNEILMPSGTYNRTIGDKDKTFLIFNYRADNIQYENYSIELPKDLKPNEIFAIHDGHGTLELIANKDTPF